MLRNFINLNPTRWDYAPIIPATLKAEATDLKVEASMADIKVWGAGGADKTQKTFSIISAQDVLSHKIKFHLVYLSCVVWASYLTSKTVFATAPSSED
jgi:hypothetical protein